MRTGELAFGQFRYPRKLPRVLSPEEAMRLLEAAPGPGLKYKAALSVAYGAGLRALEVCMLRVSGIDSKRMLIRVELGKGGSAQVASCGSAPLKWGVISPLLASRYMNRFLKYWTKTDQPRRLRARIVSYADGCVP